MSIPYPGRSFAPAKDTLDRAPLLKPAPELLVCAVPLQNPLAARGVSGVGKALREAELPRNARPSVSTLDVLMVAHARVQISGEPEVELACGVLEDLDEVHRFEPLSWRWLPGESYRGMRTSYWFQEGLSYRGPWSRGAVRLE